MVAAGVEALTILYTFEKALVSLQAARTCNGGHNSPPERPLKIVWETLQSDAPGWN